MFQDPLRPSTVLSPLLAGRGMNNSEDMLVLVSVICGQFRGHIQDCQLVLYKTPC